MEALRELISLVDIYPVGEGALKLLELLNDPNIDRAEAKKHFSSESRFSNVYKEVKDMAVNELLVSDMKDSKKYVRQWNKVIKEYTVFKILLKEEKTGAAIHYGHSLMKKARQYDLLKILYDVSTDFMNYSSGQQQSARNFKKYRGFARNYYTVLGEELQAQDVFNKLSLKTGYSLKELKSELDQLTDTAKKNNHIRFNYFYYAAHRMYRRKKKDFEGLLNVCNEALDFFDNSPYVVPNMAYFFFFYDLVPLLIRRKQYGLAERRINHCKKLPQPGSFSYHIILLLQAILGISSGKPGITTNALREAGKKWRFENPGMVQAWKMVRDELDKNEGPKSGEKLLKALYQ